MAESSGHDADTVYEFLAKLAAFQPGSIAIRYIGRKDLDYSGLLATVNYIKTDFARSWTGQKESDAM